MVPHTALDDPVYDDYTFEHQCMLWLYMPIDGAGMHGYTTATNIGYGSAHTQIEVCMYAVYTAPLTWVWMIVH